MSLGPVLCSAYFCLSQNQYHRTPFLKEENFVSTHCGLALLSTMFVSRGPCGSGVFQKLYCSIVFEKPSTVEVFETKATLNALILIKMH